MSYYFSQAQLEKLQKQIAAVAKKTGISSATKLALIAPTKDIQEGQVPDVEWWDQVILKEGKYSDSMMVEGLQGITQLVEHPVQKHPPGMSPILKVCLYCIPFYAFHLFAPIYNPLFCHTPFSVCCFV